MSDEVMFLSGNKINNNKEEHENTEEDLTIIKKLTNPTSIDVVKPLVIYNSPQHQNFHTKERFLPIEESSESLQRKIKDAERKYVEQRMDERNDLYRQRENFINDDHDDDTCAKINCRDISKHHDLCPVCNNLYKCDKTFLYLLIFLLIVGLIYCLNKLNNKLF